MKTPKNSKFLALLLLTFSTSGMLNAMHRMIPHTSPANAPQHLDQDAYDVALDAVQKGNLNTLKMLAVTGKLPTPKGAVGFKLVEAAATKPALLDYLISKGLSVDAQDTSGNTVLHYATAKGPIDDDSNRGGTSLKASNTAFPAPSYPFNGEQIFNNLLARKANPNVANNQGRTPLHVAAGFSGEVCIWGQAEWDRSCENYDAADFVAKLIVAGANANATDKQGKKPVNYAKTQVVKNILANPKNAAKYLSDKEAARQAEISRAKAQQEARKQQIKQRQQARYARIQARNKQAKGEL